MLVWVVLLFSVLLITDIILNVGAAMVVLDEGIDVLNDYFNPFYIYKSNRVNIFGCIMITIFYHLVLLPHASYFWFYKLCTVGRR